jgi:hypothetical protein
MLLLLFKSKRGVDSLCTDLLNPNMQTIDAIGQEIKKTASTDVHQKSGAFQWMINIYINRLPTHCGGI